MLTADGGIIVAVSCCTGVSFSTLDFALLSVYLDGGCIICKAASLSFHLESVDVCCKGFLFSLLDFYDAQGLRMNIGIEKL